MVLRLPASRLAAAAVLDVRAEVHVRGVQPHEERGVVGGGVGHEPQRLRNDLVVDRLHPLLGQRAGVFDPLCAVTVRPRVDHPARSEVLAEVGELLLGGVVGQFRLLFGVEVVQIAEELVEPVHGREELVAVAEVVLAELARGVAEVLEARRDRRVLGRHPDRGTRHAHLGEPGAVRVLAGDERGATCRARLLAVVVGEHHPLSRDAVDVRSAVAHHAVAVAAEVALPDVVAPDDQDVRLVGHRVPRSMFVRRCVGGSQPKVPQASAAPDAHAPARGPAHGADGTNSVP